MTSTPDTNDDLVECHRLAQVLELSLPKKIEIAALSLNSKLPFKALSIRELLLHRSSALANAAVDLFEENRIIPALVVTRAVVETVAVIYNLNKRLNQFIENKNINELDKFLMSCLMGARNNPDLPQAINVKTLIDHVDKTIPKFRAIYDILCEYTHPNWAGTFGSFGEVDRESFVLKLGPTSKKTAGFNTGLSALSGSLLAFIYFYEECAELIKLLNEFFENQEDSNGT